MNLFNISCKKATYLVSKKEEKKLSIIERWQLRAHLTICSMCRRFEDQSGLIGRNAKHLHDYLHITLSPETKQKMAENLEETKLK